MAREFPNIGVAVLHCELLYRCTLPYFILYRSFLHWRPYGSGSARGRPRAHEPWGAQAPPELGLFFYPSIQCAAVKFTVKLKRRMGCCPEPLRRERVVYSLVVNFSYF